MPSRVAALIGLRRIVLLRPPTLPLFVLPLYSSIRISSYTKATPPPSPRLISGWLRAWKAIVHASRANGPQLRASATVVASSSLPCLQRFESTATDRPQPTSSTRRAHSPPNSLRKAPHELTGVPARRSSSAWIRHKLAKKNPCATATKTPARRRPRS